MGTKQVIVIQLQSTQQVAVVQMKSTKQVVVVESVGRLSVTLYVLTQHAHIQQV